MSFNPPPGPNQPSFSYQPVPNSAPLTPPTLAPASAPVEPARLPTPAVANLCFFVGVLAFLTLSTVAQLNKWSFFLTSASGEIALALVAVFFCVMGRYNFKQTFSLRRVDLLTLFLCLVAGFVGQFAVRFPTALNEWIMQIFGPFPVDQLFPNPPDLAGRLLFFGAVVIIGPVCEEALNRGFVLGGYLHFGFWKTIFFVGLLFGLFHLYPFRFAYTFLLGMALAYLVLVTGSIWSSIAMHIGFNLLGGFSPWILDWLNQTAGDNGQQVVAGEGSIDLASLLATIPISLIGAGIFLLFVRWITGRMAKRRPELVVGYLGIARAILPPGRVPPAPTGPFYSPNGRYRYGRYGYERSDTYPNQPQIGANGYGSYPPGPFEAPAQPETPGQGTPPLNSPYTMPQGYARPGYPPLPPASQPALNPTSPVIPTPLTPQNRLWWRVSFLLIALFYLFTAYSEINIRLHPDRITPKSSSTTTPINSEDRQSALTYYNNR
jgi:membrane protease YdiL (CAAX protease family)